MNKAGKISFVPDQDHGSVADIDPGLLPMIDASVPAPDQGIDVADAGLVPEVEAEVVVTTAAGIAPRIRRGIGAEKKVLKGSKFLVFPFCTVNMTDMEQHNSLVLTYLLFTTWK